MNGKVIVFGIILLALGVAGGYYFATNYPSTGSGQAPSTSSPQQGSGQAGQAPSTSEQPLTTSTSTPIASPTVDESAVLIAAVRAGLVAEHGPDANSLNITVSKIQGNFAEGGASEEGGGAMWLAAKVNGTWKLVWDGNGTISCESTDPYNFPVSMLPECWNEATGKLITR